eukprot:4437877-Prymnesium_polylepis.1
MSEWNATPLHREEEEEEEYDTHGQAYSGHPSSSSSSIGIPNLGHHHISSSGTERRCFRCCIHHASLSVPWRATTPRARSLLGANRMAGSEQRPTRTSDDPGDRLPLGLHGGRPPRPIEQSKEPL